MYILIYDKTRKEVNFGKPKFKYPCTYNHKLQFKILKNTKTDIPNSIRQYVKKHRSYNLFLIIFPTIFR